jgi:hypothetical protein
MADRALWPEPDESANATPPTQTHVPDLRESPLATAAPMQIGYRTVEIDGLNLFDRDAGPRVDQPIAGRLS